MKKVKVYVLAYVILLVFQGLSMDAAGRSAMPPGGAPFPAARNINDEAAIALSKGDTKTLQALIDQGLDLAAFRGRIGYLLKPNIFPNAIVQKRMRDAFKLIGVPISQEELNKALRYAFGSDKPEELLALLEEGARPDAYGIELFNRIRSRLAYLPASKRKAYEELFSVLDKIIGTPLATPPGGAPFPSSAEPAAAAAGAGVPSTPPTPPVITREQLERLRQLPRISQ